MMSLTLTIIVLFVSVVYYYFKSVYFTLRGPIPGIPPHFFFGNLIHFGLFSRTPTSLPEMMLQVREKFGNVCQVWIGSMRLIIINSLEDAQHIFAHRTIYDQGDIFTQKLKLLNSKGILCLKGHYYHFCAKYFDEYLFQVLNSNDMPASLLLYFVAGKFSFI